MNEGLKMTKSEICKNYLLFENEKSIKTSIITLFLVIPVWVLMIALLLIATCIIFGIMIIPGYMYVFVASMKMICWWSKNKNVSSKNLTSDQKEMQEKYTNETQAKARKNDQFMAARAARSTLPPLPVRAARLPSPPLPLGP